MYVVIEHPTGITYHQQYGGTACRHAGIEGFLVPVHAPDSLAELRRVFEEDLRGAGAWAGIGFTWPPELLARVVRAVEEIDYWPTENAARTDSGDEPEVLRFDPLRDFDEAWIGVQTSDGPGVLIWRNSD